MAADLQVCWRQKRFLRHVRFQPTFAYRPADAGTLWTHANDRQGDTVHTPRCTSTGKLSTIDCTLFLFNRWPAYSRLGPAPGARVLRVSMTGTPFGTTDMTASAENSERKPSHMNHLGLDRAVQRDHVRPQPDVKAVKRVA